MTKRPLRVVGTRHLEVDADGNVDAILDDSFFDESGENTNVVSDDDGAEAAIAKRQALAGGLVENLAPSSFALYLGMQRALEAHTEAVETRLAGDPDHLLIGCRLPSESWHEAAKTAFAASVAGLVAERLQTQIVSTCVLPDHQRGYALPVISPGRLLSAARRGHAVACFVDPAQLPETLRPFCDALVDLTAIEPAFFGRAIARVFEVPEGTVDWPSDIALADLDADLLNDVCDRAPSAAAVPRLFKNIVSARKVAEMSADVKHEKETNKSSSTATTTRTAYVPEILYPTSPTLSELHGYGEAQAWGTQLAEDLADYVGGGLPWSDVDGGCLLFGPPGTGKTMFASALAATCALPFIATSYAQWQSAGDGHLGWVTKAIRATFETANKSAPCIVFIDEIDAVRRRGGSGDHDGWWTAITTALLECLDGTSRREGVVVIAACNHPDRLDPAMVRSGRLDRRFEIGLPDEDALLRIFAHHLPGADAEQLAPAATVLAGSTSGADVARIAREARRVARREKREVTPGDLLAIAIPTDTMPPADRRLVAVHEAGHAVALFVAGRIPDSLSIVSGGGAHGGVRSKPNFGMGRLAAFESEIIVRLAGRAAEEVILGEPSSGAEQDLMAATSLVSQQIGMAGLGGRLLHSEHVDSSAVEARLRDLYGRALRLIGDHRSVVEKLADLALEQRVLGRKALELFAFEHGLGEVR